MVYVRGSVHGLNHVVEYSSVSKEGLVWKLQQAGDFMVRLFHFPAFISFRVRSKRSVWITIICY